jgi:hypothetical protein
MNRILVRIDETTTSSNARGTTPWRELAPFELLAKIASIAEAKAASRQAPPRPISVSSSSISDLSLDATEDSSHVLVSDVTIPLGEQIYEYNDSQSSS